MLKTVFESATLKLINEALNPNAIDTIFLVQYMQINICRSIYADHNALFSIIRLENLYRVTDEPYFSFLIQKS